MCAALTLCAPKAAVTPVPWGKVVPPAVLHKDEEHKDWISVGLCPFFTHSSPLQDKLETPEILLVTPHI